MRMSLLARLCLGGLALSFLAASSALRIRETIAATFFPGLESCPYVSCRNLRDMLILFFGMCIYFETNSKSQLYYVDTERL